MLLIRYFENLEIWQWQRNVFFVLFSALNNSKPGLTKILGTKNALKQKIIWKSENWLSYFDLWKKMGQW